VGKWEILSDQQRARAPGIGWRRRVFLLILQRAIRGAGAPAADLRRDAVRDF